VNSTILVQGEDTLEVVKCWCGICFAVPQPLWNEYERKNDAAPKSFAIHCPLGHGMTRGVSNALKEARDTIARKQAWIDQQAARIKELYDETARKERSIRGYKGVVARNKRRISKGMCPCCSRKFKDLGSHMAAEHPDWNPDKEADARGAKADA